MPQSNRNTSRNRMSTDIQEVAVITTSEGEMTVEFWPDVAPRTVENFKALARQGFYVEPTSAIVWSALRQVSGQVPNPVVVILSGSGLKSG